MKYKVKLPQPLPTPFFPDILVSAFYSFLCSKCAAVVPHNPTDRIDLVGISICT